MKNKKQLVIATSVLVVTTILLLGLTYAYYKTRINGNSKDKSISVTSKKLEITYGDGNGIISPTEKIEPGYTTTKTFTVENTGDEVVNYSIKLDNITNTFSRIEDWTYVLKKGETEVSSGVIPVTEMYILNTISIDSKVTDSYSLTITYANLTDVDQSIDMGKSLNLRVNIDDFSNPYVNNKNSLAYNIINNAALNKNDTFYLKKSKTKVAEEVSGTWNSDKYAFETVSTDSDLFCAGYEFLLVGDSEEEALTGSSITSFEEAVGKYVSDLCFGWVKYLESYDADNSILKFRIKVNEYEKNLLMTEDDYGDSYYFRGNVINNYIDFAGMCWRIVRIQGDGSIKIILEDQDNTCKEADGNWNIPTKGDESVKIGNFGHTKYEENTLTASDGFKNQYIEYIMDYLNGTTDDNKSIAKAFENFQEKKLSQYLEKLKSGNWCLEEKGYASENNNVAPLTSEQILNNKIKLISVYYNSRIRLNVNEPTLKCYGTLMNKFSNETTNMYVGTLTADEIIYAGGKISADNPNYYLVNKYQKENSLLFWSLSPNEYSRYTDQVFYVSESGSVSSSLVRELLSFRPAIVLKSDTTITSGNGTQTNPYVVS